MAQGKTTSEVEKLRERGKRLWRNYLWTNERYDALFELQGGRCAGCGRKPKNAPLQVDHDHFHVNTELTGNSNKEQKWMATATLKDGRQFIEYGPTKALATHRVKQAALPHSVRGLLCPGRQRGCNRLLGRIDDVHLLENFLAYLKDPPAKKLDKAFPI